MCGREANEVGKRIQHTRAEAVFALRQWRYNNERCDAVNEGYGLAVESVDLFDGLLVSCMSAAAVDRRRSGFTARVEDDVAAHRTQAFLVRALLTARVGALGVLLSESAPSFLLFPSRPGTRRQELGYGWQRPTLQSMHLPPFGLTLPFAPTAPGRAYGLALDRADNSLFSPILRVEEDGWNGSGAARVDSFCPSAPPYHRKAVAADLFALFAHHLGDG